MANRIFIRLLKSISPLGHQKEGVSKTYFEDPSPCFSLNEASVYTGSIKGESFDDLESFCLERGLNSDKYSRESKLLAYVFERSDIDFTSQENVALNVATSRGNLDFLASIASKSIDNIPSYTSPYSTLGFLSSWPNMMSQKVDFDFLTSSTCSSFGAVLLNGLAWLRSGMADRFLAAAVESPIRDFTINQMKAMNLYTSFPAGEKYPCKGGDLSKKRNTMVLGEAAYLYELSRKEGSHEISSIGVSMERPDNPASVDKEGIGLQQAVRKSLDSFSGTSIDLIIGHLPGTIRGDQAEINAYKAVFDDRIPPVIGNKWKVGHSLGASLASSIELALTIFEQQALPPMPPFFEINTSKFKEINSILITALGFGGQSVSLILSRNQERAINLVD